MQNRNQSNYAGFTFMRQIGENRRAGGGILAAVTSVLVLGAGLILGSFLLLAAIVVGLGLLIAFLIWRFFFMRSIKKKAEAFMAGNEDVMQKMRQGASQDQSGTGGKGGNRGSTVIDGEYEDITPSDR